MKKAILGCMIILTTACTGLRVTTDYDTSYDFNSIQSYAWMAPKPKLISDPLVDNDLMDQRIRNAIDVQLARLNISKTDNAKKADILVTYTIDTVEKIEADNFQMHFGYYNCYGCRYGFGGIFSPETRIDQYTAGNYFIDFVSPTDQKLLWRGMVQRRLQGDVAPEKRDEHIDYIVSEILSHLPVAANQEP